MIKDILISLSLANLCFISIWSKLLNFEYTSYFMKFFYSNNLIAAMLNILSFSAVIFCTTRFIRRHCCDKLQRFFHILFFIIFGLSINSARQESAISFLELSKQIGTWKMIYTVGLVFIIILFLAWKFRHKLVGFTVFAVLLLVPFALFTFSKALFLILSIDKTHFADKPAARWHTDTNPAGARVIWFIFDELDQRQTFDMRSASLNLPELDRLRGESFYAANAYPPAGMTIRSLSSLITGRLVTNATPAGPDNLVLTLNKTEDKHSWTSLTNVFSEAQNLGVNTALVGWYHPYARVLNKTLNYCVWHPVDVFNADDSENLLNRCFYQWRYIATKLPLVHRLIQRFPYAEMQYHINMYRSTLSDATTLANDKKFSLIMIHWPLPHVPFIYDRVVPGFSFKEKQREESYLDNLALVDRTIGEIRKEMESAGTWNTTTVIVSSDHWRRQEPSNFYFGTVDNRIPFIVKLAGSKAPVVYSKPFNTVITKKLILDVLQNKISSARGIAGFIDRNSTFGRVPY